MFVDDFCEDWDSSKKQDDFIQTYFSKIKVNSRKTSNTLKTVEKVRNSATKQDNEDNYESSPKCHFNKRSLDYQKESNRKREKKEKYLHDSSQQSCSEVHFESQNMQVIESSNFESDGIKNKKKKKRAKLEKNISYESSEQVNSIQDSNSMGKTIKNNFSSDSTQSVNLYRGESDSNFLKLKKKEKRLKKKAKIILEEKSSVSDDETGTIKYAVSCESATENNFDSNCLKMEKKKKKFKTALQPDKFSDEAEPTNVKNSNNLSIKKSNLVQSKAYQKLQAAKFRYLNEMLYTNSGKDALSYFQENTDEFLDYHEGYQSQVLKWPINPVDVIIQEISQMNKKTVIADLGCGEARIMEMFPNRTVYSFDLIALKDCVTACDMANLPLPNNSVDAVVFCLSLMGTNWKDYLKEGHRILKLGGIIKIAEIESRIENLQHFIKEIENVGFSLVNKNLSHKMFVFLNFKRIKRSKKSSKLSEVTLKPCLYKKR